MASYCIGLVLLGLSYLFVTQAKVFEETCTTTQKMLKVTIFGF